jgi:hypothetical protein
MELGLGAVGRHISGVQPLSKEHEEILTRASRDLSTMVSNDE